MLRIGALWFGAVALLGCEQHDYGVQVDEPGDPHRLAIPSWWCLKTLLFGYRYL